MATTYEITICEGTRADYKKLSRYHYKGKTPASLTRVLRAMHGEALAGVLVVSRPLMNGSWRSLLWPRDEEEADKLARAALLNEKLRCISRVVVHPRYRGGGLARQLVRAYLSDPLTERTEAVAKMGAFCSFFEDAGMEEVEVAKTRRDTELLGALKRVKMQPWQLVHPSAVRKLSPGKRRDLDRALRRWANDSRGTRGLKKLPLERIMAAAAPNLSGTARTRAYGFDRDELMPRIELPWVLDILCDKDKRGTAKVDRKDDLVPKDKGHTECAIDGDSSESPEADRVVEVVHEGEGYSLEGGLNHELPPRTPKQLAALLLHMGISVPGRSLASGENGSAMAYLVHSFFEGRRFECADKYTDGRAPADCVVWANRGGGKTFLGAVATMLDMVYKPGIQIRILGGSLEQSKRMQDHLTRLFEHPLLAEMVDRERGATGSRALVLDNGSRAEILAASETSVRGVRVQKLRCDEVELFTPALWRAAQLTTRSMKCSGPWGSHVRGCVEALSTMHLPYGIMWDLVGGGTGAGSEQSRGAAEPLRRIFRWGLIDSLEKCGDEHACNACNLFDECRGIAKATEPAHVGHITITDAQGQKRRVDIDTWKSEMLCLEPRKNALVYPEFNTTRHIVGLAGEPADAAHDSLTHAGDMPREWIAGMDFGFRSDTVILFARLRDNGALVIEHEFVARERVLERHIETVKEFMRERGGMGALKWLGADPAGNNRNEQTGEASLSLMRAAGIPARGRKMSNVDGFRLVRTRLAPADGPVRLFIHARCTRLIESLRRYHFKAGTDGRCQEPAKGQWDHACDALRYLVTTLDGGGETVSSEW